MVVKFATCQEDGLVVGDTNQNSVFMPVALSFSIALCPSPPRMLQDLVNARSLIGVQPHHFGDHVPGAGSEVQRIIH